MSRLSDRLLKITRSSGPAGTKITFASAVDVVVSDIVAEVVVAVITEKRRKEVKGRMTVLQHHRLRSRKLEPELALHLRTKPISLVMSQSRETDGNRRSNTSLPNE